MKHSCHDAITSHMSFVAQPCNKQDVNRMKLRTSYVEQNHSDRNEIRSKNGMF